MPLEQIQWLFYLKAIGAEVQPPPRAGGEASSDDGFRRILTTRESVEAELDVTGFGELCTVFVAGTMSISTVLLWAGDTRISGWVQSISTVLPVDPGAAKKIKIFEDSLNHAANSQLPDSANENKCNLNHTRNSLFIFDYNPII